MVKKYFIFLGILSFIFFTKTVLANDLDLSLSIKESLKISKPYDCDNVVSEINFISMDYLSLKGYSIEQIYERKVILDENYEISCSGKALLSDATRKNIFYRAYIDEENDWIVEYIIE